MLTTLGLVLTVGALATIYSQQAFALVPPPGTHCISGPVCGGNAGNGGIGVSGGVCTTPNCHASGASANGGSGGAANGGQGGNAGNGGIGENGGNGGIGTPGVHNP